MVLALGREPVGLFFAIKVLTGVGSLGLAIMKIAALRKRIQHVVFAVAADLSLLAIIENLHLLGTIIIRENS